MKKLFLLGLSAGLVLTGCRKAGAPSPPLLPPPSAPPGTESDRDHADYRPQPAHALPNQEVSLLEQINRESIRVIASALPSIVRITSTHPADPHLQIFGGDLPFFGPHGNHESSETWFGSGVIIGKDGTIVTNQHVVDSGRNIQVQLHDRRTYPARLIAADVIFDIAVLKIDAPDLVAIPWGNSDRLQVGEQVFAIGNPWDLGESVSRGIVSAKGRNLPDTSNYEDYVQTDAAINPGNSGGALVNVRGDLVGINAAIATMAMSRSNTGVGFAIPSNLARYAVEGLLKRGRLVRGFLGLNLDDQVSRGLIDKLGLHDRSGVLVSGVQPGSPAEKAQLQPWDLITEIDGHKVSLLADLRLFVAQLPVGKKVEVRYIRGGKPASTEAEIVEAQDSSGSPDLEQLPPALSAPGLPPPPRGAVLDGLQVANLSDQTRRKFAIDRAVVSGVVVIALTPGSVGERQGLLPGDVIQSACVDRASTRQIRSMQDFTQIAQQLSPGADLALLVQRHENNTFIFLSPTQ